MANVGNQKDEILKVDKIRFKEKLNGLMASCDKLDANLFFKLVHQTMTLQLMT